MADDENLRKLKVKNVEPSLKRLLSSLNEGLFLTSDSRLFFFKIHLFVRSNIPAVVSSKTRITVNTPISPYPSNIIYRLKRI